MMLAQAGMVRQGNCTGLRFLACLVQGSLMGMPLVFSIGVFSLAVGAPTPVAWWSLEAFGGLAGAALLLSTVELGLRKLGTSRGKAGQQVDMWAQEWDALMRRSVR